MDCRAINNRSLKRIIAPDPFQKKVGKRKKKKELLYWASATDAAYNMRTTCSNVVVAAALSDAKLRKLRH